MRARVLVLLAGVLMVGATVLLSACARPAGPVASSLTGLPLGPDDSPVLAVKIDNSRAARPWTGLDAADVVYVEPVEGGSTRLLALFASKRPASVGPVRSFRESDLDVLAAYGRPGLVYSGAAPELAGALAAAPVLPLSPAQVPGAFRRDPARDAPDNLYADPGALVAAAVSSGGASSADAAGTGFTFGAVPAGGTPDAEERVELGSTRVGATWDAGAGRWSLSFDGRPATTRDGVTVQASTVLVQSVRTVPTAVSDVAGRVSPKAETVGEGAVRVLRDGAVFAGRWSRPSPDAGTTVTAPDGSALPFAAGPLWVLLVPDG